MGQPAGPVLIVDDDSNLCAAIRALLQRAGFRVIAAQTGDEGLAAARREQPSVVLLDVNLPGVNGYEVCYELRSTFGADLPIVFLTGERTEPYDHVSGFLIGADDYIVKPFDPDELIARIRRLALRRRTAGEPSGVARPAEVLAKLTPREREVLLLLLDGLSQREIAEKLYISDKTTATHIQRILQKLGVRSRAQAVALAART